MLHSLPARLAGLSLAVIAFSAGCSRNPVKSPMSAGEANLNTIANAYTDTVQRNGRGPANQEQLKKGLEQITAVIGGSPDDILVSPNDGEPYVIIYNINLRSGGTPILAYEKKGNGAKRWIVDLRKVARHMTEEEFRGQSFPAGHKPD